MSGACSMDGGEEYAKYLSKKIQFGRLHMKGSD